MSLKKFRSLILGDQLVNSGSTFTANIVVAKYFPPDDFALFSYVIYFSYFLLGLSNALVYIPLLSSFHAVDNKDNEMFFERHAAQLLSLSAIIIAFILVGSIITYAFNARFHCLGLLFTAPVAVGLSFYELNRKLAIAQNLVGKQIVRSSGLFLFNILALLFCYFERLSIGWYLLILGLVYFSISLNSYILRALKKWSVASVDVKNSGNWILFSHLAFFGYNFGIQVILSIVVSPNNLAIFYASRTAFSPAFVLLTSYDSFEKLTASKAFGAQGIAGVIASIRNNILFYLGVLCPFIILLIVLDKPIYHYVFNDKYIPDTVLLLAWGCTVLIMIFTQPIESALCAITRTKSMFYIRSIAGVVALIFAAIFCPILGVLGGVLAMIIGWICTCVLSYATIFRFRQLQN